MPLSHMFKILSLITTLSICTASAQAQNIEIAFTGIASARGQIIVKIFTDEKNFQDNKALKTIKFKKSDIVGGRLVGKLSLDPGTYGFALLDDENGNNIMDNNLFGMPKEGFGFSNFYLSGMKKPHFEQFKFTVAKSQQVKIDMKLRYL